jgi:hypothetical protein
MKTARIIGSFMVGMLFFSLANNIAAQTICDSIVAIDSLYYYKHQLPYTIIDTTNLPKKVGHEIVVAFGDSVLRFEDEKIIDQEHGDWYNCPYSIIGMDRKRNWVLVEKTCLVEITHYLINSTSKTIDTLKGDVFIFGNKMINFDNEYLGAPWNIDLREIIGKNFVLKRKIGNKVKCDFFPSGITISDRNELMLIGFKREKFYYYKIKL